MTETKWPTCSHPECNEDARRGVHCWAHQPARAAAGHAVVFWDCNAYWWTPGGTERRGPFSGDDGLDDAITDAKAKGFKIYEVNRTRGDLPALSPQATPGRVGE